MLKGLLKSWIGEYDLLGEELFQLVERGLAGGRPGKLGVLLGETGKGREEFRVMGNVVFVVVDHAYKGADLFDICRR